MNKLSKFKYIKLLLVMVLIFTGCSINVDEASVEVIASNNEASIVDQSEDNVSSIIIVENNDAFSFEGNLLIEVDGGDLSGHREANVVVDIGYGDREYFAFTNEYGQLVRVVAKEIILQDDDKEPVLSTGRYYRDEAKVPGVESKTLDEGHVIADSLGGVSNAYNITPQNLTLNRHGDQAYMERNIRDAGGCTEFVAIITYPDTKTQIPSQYDMTYTLKGNVIHDVFENINPDEVNEVINNVDDTSTDRVVEQASVQSIENSPLKIVSVGLSSEEVTIKNMTGESLQLEGYMLLSVIGNQSYVFPKHLLESGESVIVFSGKGTGDLKWTGKYIWNNNGDPAELYDYKGALLDKYK